MGKFISGLFLGALALGLSIFTGSRTLDLLAWALPATQQIYQWLGLCAFEGGMLFWSYYFIMGAKGTPQRSISICMAVFSIVAVSVCTIAALSLDASQKGGIAKLSPDAAQAIIIFVGVVIVVNVAAYLCCHLFSVENLRRMKEQEAEDKIYEAGLRAISGLAPAIAADAAPHLATEWANRTWQRIVPGVAHQTYYLPNQQQTPAIAAPAPVTLGQTKSIDSPIQPSEKTSNQLYREQQRNYRAAYQPDYKARAVVDARRKNRQARLARPTGNIIDAHGNPITSASIKKEKERPEPETEKIAVPLAQGVPAADQGANSPMKNMRMPGVRGRKRASAPGATRGK